MAIDYIAYNRAGARVVGAVDVDTLEEAEERLWASGLLVVQLKRHRERERRSLLVRFFPTLFGARLKDVVTATRQIETLLRAGVALPIALRQIRDQTLNPGIRDTLGSVLRDIEGGERFSTACARHPQVFPSYFLRLLPIAEETGNLPDILKGLLRTMERQQKVAAQARAAVITPAISMGVALIAGVVLITFVLPRLVELMGEFRAGKLPASTRMLVNLSHWGQSYGLYSVLSLGVALVAGNLYFTRTPQGIHVKDRILLSLPLLSVIVQTSAMFEVCSSLGLLLRSGISPVATLRSVTSMMGNRVLQEAFARVDGDVTQGMRLGESCRRQADIPSLFSNTMVNGEQAGSLLQNLDALTDYYEAETERAVSQGTNLIQPALVLLVGAFVGFIAISIIAGIYSIIPQISGSI